jgi:hypothetical protein
MPETWRFTLCSLGKRGSQPFGIKIMVAHIYVARAKSIRKKRVITCKKPSDQLL